MPKFWNLGQEGFLLGANQDVVVDSDFLLKCAKEWNSQLTITRKMDGQCFLGHTKLNLWDGGTISIGEVVKKRLNVPLVGRDSNGNIVPCKILNWFDNGKKYNWMLLTVDCLPSRKAGSRTGNHLPITEEHEIVLNGEFSRASEAEIGDTMLTYLSVPSPSVLHTIKAALLGDGCLVHHGGSYVFSEGHKEEHADYIKALSTLLGECGLTPYHSMSGFGSRMLTVGSKAYLTLKEVREEWYPHGIKTAPRDLSWLDDFAVALWYMGDGSLSHTDFQQDRAQFATNGFIQGDVERLAYKLQQMYSVDAKAFDDGKGWAIRINAGKSREIDTFWKAIAPHVIPSMRYKLPVEFRGVEHIAFAYGSEVRVAVDCKITNVVRFIDPKSSYFRSGRRGYDIQTSTGNYFCKGVLVHNCGILWNYEDQWGIATRGSFESEGAKFATQKFQKFVKYGAVEFIPKGWTLFFEIISKELRIVIPYEWEGLCLLTAVNNETGEEMSYERLHELWVSLNSYSKTLDAEGNSVPGKPWCRLVEKFDIDLETAKNDKSMDEEGYVVSINRPLMTPVKAKVKLAEYLRLHKILCNVTPQMIWGAKVYPTDQWLGVNSWMDRKTKEVQTTLPVPPEFAQWVRQWDRGLTAYFHKYLVEAMEAQAALFASELNSPFKNDMERKRWLTDYHVTKYSRAIADAAINLRCNRIVEAYEILWRLVRPQGKDERFYAEGKGE